MWVGAIKLHNEKKHHTSIIEVYQVFKSHTTTLCKEQREMYDAIYRKYFPNWADRSAYVSQYMFILY